MQRASLNCTPQKPSYFSVLLADALDVNCAEGSEPSLTVTRKGNGAFTGASMLQRALKRVLVRSLS